MRATTGGEQRAAFAPCVAGLALLCASLACADNAPVFPRPGEWPCYRGNSRLDARASCKGRISEPAIAWRRFVGRTETLLVLRPAEGEQTVSIPPSEAPSTSSLTARPEWGLIAPLDLIAGQQRPAASSSTVTYADVFPETPGLEKLEFESGFAKPTVNGQWQPCVGRCFRWENGQWVQAWQTPPIDMLFAPYPIAGDFDGDGELEVAILPWYELMILDARTGAIEERCRFTKGRSYGFFGAYDIDGDGDSEFVVQADFSKHVDVLGYRGDKLTVLWQREIELDISNPRKILRAHPVSAAELDDDGRLEVLVSLYDATTDGRWHLVIHDGLSGTVEHDIADEYLQGVRDLDGDGVAELLTTCAVGAGVPEAGTIQVRGFRAGAENVLWQTDAAAWETWEPALPANTNTGATFGHRQALCRGEEGKSWAVIRRAGSSGRPALALASWGPDGLEQVAEVTGAGLSAVAMAPDGEVLIKSVAGPGREERVSCVGGALEVGASRRLGICPATVAVVSDPQSGAPVLIAQGSGEELVAFRGAAAEGDLAELWRVTGRGQATGWPWQVLGPVVGDLGGDGGREVIYATAAPSGCGRLVAMRLDGAELWRHDFPDIPGSAPVWNTGGIILWQTGRFTRPAGQDVLVTIRRSMMHSEETVLLSGKDGSELWRRARQISNRGVGGTPLAIADFDGDGLEDAASLHPSILYILRGTTGEDIVARDASWPGVPAQPVYWGVPVAGRFDGTGAMNLFFGTQRRSMTGLRRADGDLTWWDALDRSPSALPAFGDLDGDGEIEALGVGYDDGARCYDAATGTVEWRLPFEPGAGVAGTGSGDIDSDGRDEAVIAAGTKLYCLGEDDDGAGEVAWELGLPATLGPPAIADATGDGAACIIAAAADGYVYCVR